MLGAQQKPVDLRRSRAAFLGPPKVGKSELHSRRPGIVYLNLDDGLNHLDVYSTGLVTTWEGVQEAYREIREDIKEGNKLEAVVIDTIDRLYELACDEVARRLKVPVISRMNDYGASYHEAQMLVMKVLHGLHTELGLGVFLLGHTRTIERDSPQGIKITSQESDMSRGMQEKLVCWLQFIFQLGLIPAELVSLERTRDKKKIGQFADVEHVLYTGVSPHLLCGGRFYSEPPAYIPLPRAPEGWDKVLAKLQPLLEPKKTASKPVQEKPEVPQPAEAEPPEEAPVEDLVDGK